MSRSVAVGLCLGYVADRILGDPPRHHPVAWFGQLATTTEKHIWANNRKHGVLYTSLLLTAVTGTALAINSQTRSPWQRCLLTAATTWIALGGKSLEAEGEAMAARLDTATISGDLTAARERLSHLCSRDASALTADELARATVESLAENTSDAVTGAVFWGAVAGVPGIVLYRAANTLDAMVGYRSDRYEKFGWASARLDDLLNYLPARVTAAVTVAIAPAFGGYTAVIRACRAWWHDAPAHPSPNAGSVEATAAGVLGVSLGGTNMYAGSQETRGKLGTGPAPVVDDVRRAITLTRTVAATATAACVALAWVLPSRRRTTTPRSTL
ncbi:cobalamin biosynthesis protein [Dermatophilus congolensis]|uniref:cobalamin biosynthesis protein n=1 Tax=Dermatophilus congolensis TaxID=1863 RepID=UPI000487AFB6|nr:cobalamin biosynthesis protein [Dermatophilus congolensis]